MLFLNNMDFYYKIKCADLRLSVGESPQGDTEGSHIRGFRADK